MDRRWFIVCPNNSGIVYTLPGGTGAEAWLNFTMADEPLGTGIDRTLAYKMGYRAKKCEIFIEVDEKP